MPVNTKKSKPRPKAKTPKKKRGGSGPPPTSQSQKERPPLNRNTNFVLVHVISVSDGGLVPPPYAGSYRSYFAFNRVFDIGLQKAPNQPPMNTGDPISVGSIKRAAETPTQSGNGGFI